MINLALRLESRGTLQRAPTQTKNIRQILSRGVSQSGGACRNVVDHTTMIYTHALSKGGHGVQNPVGEL